MIYKKRQECLIDSEHTLATIPLRLAAFLADLLIINLINFTISIILFKWIDPEIHITWLKFRHFEIEAPNISENGILILKVFFWFIPIIYFFLSNYITNGQSIGKKVFGIKIVSIYHHRIGLWHCIERSLGYLVSTFELGLGFLQAFWNPNRMTLHDKIAETVVIKTRITKNK